MMPKELRQPSEEGFEGDGFFCFVKVGGGGETEGEGGNAVLDENGEVGVAGTGGGLDPEFVVNLARGGDEGMIKGDAAGLAQGGEGDGAIGGGFG